MTVKAQRDLVTLALALTASRGKQPSWFNVTNRGRDSKVTIGGHFL